METTKIADQILAMTETLSKMRAEIKSRSQAKAQAIANYDKSLALMLLKLRNGVEMELEGEKIKDPPTTIMEKIAKGLIWKERLALEEAEGLYKSLISNLESVKAELNGLQSINRHLDSN